MGAPLANASLGLSISKQLHTSSLMEWPTGPPLVNNLSPLANFVTIPLPSKPATQDITQYILNISRYPARQSAGSGVAVLFRETFSPGESLQSRDLIASC